MVLAQRTPGGAAEEYHCQNGKKTDCGTAIPVAVNRPPVPLNHGRRTLPMSTEADLKQVIYALSDALDLVGVDDVAHGKRVGIMAAECSTSLGFDRAQTAFMFELGLLHDIGVSSTRTHKHLVDEFDWEGSQEHTHIGFSLLSGFPPLSLMALPIRYHHTRWDTLMAAGVDPSVAEPANLTLLVDRVDAMAAPLYATNSVLLHKDAIRESIINRTGTYFAPHLVEAFHEASRTEAFWLLLEPRSIQSYLREQLAQSQPVVMTLDELKQLAAIFSRIVDAKSPFTAEHSSGVARLSRFLAEKMGVSQEHCDKIEVAGLLHDLGKLRVPDEVLDKPAQLDRIERLSINTHTFETYQILNNIKGFAEIACWAAYHHEEPDGTGYPFHLRAESMPLEARILRVADIFQAMAQDRPYRKGLPQNEVIAFLIRLAEQGRVDAAIVATAERWLDDAMRAARPELFPHS
jgi:putative nucleotidyltransferase with HDIG domain